jgi:hypothetical protein
MPPFLRRPPLCATVSLSTKIKGLHENDFIMASKIDRMADRCSAAISTLIVAFRREGSRGPAL